MTRGENFVRMIGMHKFIQNIAFLFAFLFSSFIIFADVKEEIIKEEAFLQKVLTQEEKQKAYFHLACAYYKDQELDKAFFNFLLALRNSPHRQECQMSSEEEKIYSEAFKYYLSQGSIDPFKTSQELLERYENILEKHPEYKHLNFLLSAAYGNLGDYLLFFEHFYLAFPFMWDTYLSYKTQGILYLRLSQRSKTKEERLTLQKEATRFLNLALQKEHNDAGLYKILISLAKEDKSHPLVLTYLQKMVQAEAVIPRGDIFLYVKEAVALEEYELGQKMIDQAKRTYEFSRALSAAQNYLDQYKNG